MMTKEKDKPFSISLKILVELLIGDADYVTLSPKYKSLAELLEIAARDTYLLAIQWEHEETGEPIIRLWRWHRWSESTEKWQRAKERSKRERVERFILAHNIKLVALACEKYFTMDAKFAESTAYGIMKDKKIGVVKMLNVKLIEKEEEL